MGCGHSKKKLPHSPHQNSPSSAPHHEAGHDLAVRISACVMIQKFFRRYQARLELLRRLNWTIFEGIEYSGELSQLKLSAFFLNLMKSRDSVAHKQKRAFDNLASELSHVQSESIPLLLQSIQHKQEPLYDERHKFTHHDVKHILETCKKHEIIDADLAIKIIHSAVLRLSQKPLVQDVNFEDLPKDAKVVLVGDLHGQYEDLMLIFEKAGVPSKHNIFIFNGDFVDRGTRGVEVTLLMLAFYLAYPDSVYINRGNHEDFMMNKRYGFNNEVMLKYKTRARDLQGSFRLLFAVLPYAVILNRSHLVLHGGIGPNLNLQSLRDRADRIPSIVSVIKQSDTTGSSYDPIIDVLWSDPVGADHNGDTSRRGAGALWPPSATISFLEKNSLKMIVRSHQCVLEGFEYVHGGKVLTLFSASNYHAVGSNQGAFAIMDMRGDLSCHSYSVSYISDISSGFRKGGQSKQIYAVEQSSTVGIKALMFEHASALQSAFDECDPSKTGTISVTQWVACMDKVLHIGPIPWRSIARRFAQLDGQGRVLYGSCFSPTPPPISESGPISSAEEGITARKLSSIPPSDHLSPLQNINDALLDNCDKDRKNMKLLRKMSSQVLPVGKKEENFKVYSHLQTLEFIFRLIDADCSGAISKDELKDALSLVAEFVPSQDPVIVLDIDELLKTLDLNHDGKVDFNEFVEAFRLSTVGSK